MSTFFQFGSTVEGYDIPVLNERELRAGAGILFVFALTAFLHAVLIKEYFLLKLFIITFLTDFIIRVFINPRYAPTLIIGRLLTKNQTPEYTGAVQKRFAWSLGIGLATLMFILVVLLEIKGPVNLAICLICLTLLFLESACGICVGCIIYTAITKHSAKYCPGGTCEIRKRHSIQDITPVQVIITLLWIATLISIALFIR